MNAPPEPTLTPLGCSAVATHHWLVRRRGGEKVLEALLELLSSETPIHTLVYDAAGYDGGPFLASRRVESSWLQRIPGARRHYPKLLPLMPSAARAMRLPAVDLVLCSDAAISKAMTAHERSRVVCYCHSPMRYVWDLAEVYRATLPPPLRPFWHIVCSRLRAADRAAAERVNIFVANSKHVAERIRRAYDRDALVVYPPVEIPPSPPEDTQREAFYLCVGHHVAYKRLDLAVEATRQIGRPLVVIGEGPSVDALRRDTPGHVTLLGWQPDAVVQAHYRRAAALLFPGEEDFGIVPVEAMAHGCPVIAYGVGGAAESIVHSQTGVLFAAQSRQSLVEATRLANEIRFVPGVLYERARDFSRERFLSAMRSICENALDSSVRSSATIQNNV